MSQKLKSSILLVAEQLHPELLEGFIATMNYLSPNWRLVDVEDGKEKLTLFMILPAVMIDKAGVPLNCIKNADRREALKDANLSPPSYALVNLP